jgi:2'-5' RNA ligase
MAQSSGSVTFEEPFAYHPHVTLAQDISHQHVADLIKLAERRWQEFRGQRSFRAERAVFVQNTISDRWLDLAEYRLSSTPVNL